MVVSLEPILASMITTASPTSETLSNIFNSYSHVFFTELETIAAVAVIDISLLNVYRDRF